MHVPVSKSLEKRIKFSMTSKKPKKEEDKESIIEENIHLNEQTEAENELKKLKTTLNKACSQLSRLENLHILLDQELKGIIEELPNPDSDKTTAHLDPERLNKKYEELINQDPFSAGPLIKHAAMNTHQRENSFRIEKNLALKSFRISIKEIDRINAQCRDITQENI